MFRVHQRVQILNSYLDDDRQRGYIVSFRSDGKEVQVQLDGRVAPLWFTATSLEAETYSGIPLFAAQPAPKCPPPAAPMWQATPPATKPTNPKDAAALAKCPLHLLSPQAKAHWAIAQQIGALKYGSWNWTVAGVSASVYVSAIQRHVDRWFAGQEYDPDGQHNLGAVMACAAILLDAQHRNMLTDDRPIPVDMTKLYAELEGISKEMIKATAGYTPQHCYAKVATTFKT